MYKTAGKVDGGEGSGTPLADRDELPPADDREVEDDLKELTDGDFDPGWEDGDPADRRRDPLRRP